MLKTGDIIYKVTLEGYDIPCVVVKKYKVGQHLSKIDGTESGGYLLKRAVRADQYKGGRKMIDYEKLLDALQTIQNECAKYKCCTDCPFFVQSEDINCGILSRNPVNWKLNKVHVIRLINQ